MSKISLKAARVNAGLTQADVGKELGVSKQTISHWESGRNDVPAKSFLILCGLYGKTPDDIFLP